MAGENEYTPLPPQGEPVAGAPATGSVPTQPTAPPPPNGSPVVQAQQHSQQSPPPPGGIPVIRNDAPVSAPAQVESANPATQSANASVPATQTHPQENPPAPVVGATPAPTGQPVFYAKNTAKDGINKCPYCGSSDMQLNVNTGLLHCNYCHKEFSEEIDPIHGDISQLSGVHMGMGATDILFDASDIITLKCTACGAEVVVDTNEAPQARCHWCRHTLSLNQQVPNGAVPDALMPFRIPKEHARVLIEQFVGKRRFYAHPRFRAEFSTENIMGAYLPYMVVDVNTHAVFRGEGEHETRRYTVSSGDDTETRYDADLYHVGREFDLYIDDLTLEASSDKLNQNTAINSNNVINSILPFPLKEAVRFNANYLRGFTSEKRSVNRDQLQGVAGAQIGDVARWQAWQQARFYDRGIRWDVEDVQVKGELWKTVYLPVWLYSYLQVKSNGEKFLHYVAVNACTGETMGSIPIHMPKLLAISAVVEVIGIVVGIALAVGIVLF